MGEKHLKTFDMRNFSKPLQAVKLPGKGSGLPFLQYDQTASILFVTTRGDASVSLLEWGNRTLSLLPEQKYPKQASNCGFRTEYESKCITVASLIIGRKSEEFAVDLHTTCATGEPALAAPDWFAGENASPITAGMHPADEGELQFPDREPENTQVLNFDEEHLTLE
eukprot:Gregarina_sp_Poly_1__5957@NODE_3138_length_1346_cov_17_024238_g1995_i0_p1_GENE_NODE_3138_length_1346_cov_17_024238_g1995_i0NODE_3138_length_1346_cov_17_024238_g1995_i0_p1_ORF_typecomplete_len167_score22_86WD40_4/PF16300_5/3_3e06_NODE_3138_length_1346_cov_17_024238_g1995_i07971297